MQYKTIFSTLVLAMVGSACEAAPEDLARGGVAYLAPDPLDYAGAGIFTRSVNRSLRSTHTPAKQFPFRVTNGTPVVLGLQHSGNQGAHFEIEFASSPTSTTWTTPTYPAACDTYNERNVNSTNVNRSCTVTAIGEFARVAMTLANTSTTTDFELTYTFTGPCNPGHGCVETNEVLVSSIPVYTATVANVKPEISAGVLPALYDGERATVYVWRTHGNVRLNDGVKLKDVANPQYDGIDFDCGVVPGGATGWLTSGSPGWIAPPSGFLATAEMMTCVLVGSATEDSEIHVPLQRSSTANAAAQAMVRIVRSDRWVRPGSTGANIAP